jgi:hypothetical protein
MVNGVLGKPLEGVFTIIFTRNARNATTGQSLTVGSQLPPPPLVGTFGTAGPGWYFPLIDHPQCILLVYTQRPCSSAHHHITEYCSVGCRFWHELIRGLIWVFASLPRSWCGSLVFGLEDTRICTKDFKSRNLPPSISFVLKPCNWVPRIFYS